MDSMDAALLQLLGLTCRLQHSDKISNDQIKLLNELTEKVSKEGANIKKDRETMERKLTASTKQEFYLKRQFKESKKEIDILKAKIQRLEKENGDLKKKCKDMEEDLDSSWIEDINENYANGTPQKEDAELPKPQMNLKTKDNEHTE